MPRRTSKTAKMRLLTQALKREEAALRERERCARACLAEAQAKLRLLWRVKASHADEVPDHLRD